MNSILKSPYVANLYLRLKNVVPDNSVTLTSSPFSLVELPTPSNDVIFKCLLEYFLENREVYDMEMQKLKAERYISFDHTFKIASNS